MGDIIPCLVCSIGFPKKNFFLDMFSIIAEEWQDWMMFLLYAFQFWVAMYVALEDWKTMYY